MTAALTRPAAPDAPADAGSSLDPGSPVEPGSPLEPPAGGRPASRPWAGLAAAALLGAGLVGVHLVLSARMKVPIIHPDEYGYVAIAHHLVHGGPRPEAEYYPGFSLFLVPVWLVSHGPLSVWKDAALAINAGLSGVSGLVTWALCGRLAPAMTTRPRLAITALVCLYPPFLLYSNLALAECLFTVIFGVVVLVASRALPGRVPGWWAALGVASGALVLVHPRGLAVVVAVTLLGLVVLRPWRANLAHLVALGAGLALSLGATRALVVATRGRYLGAVAAYRPDSVLSKSLSAHGLVSLAWELAGQMFYLAVATIGLVPFGLFLGLRAMQAVRRGDRSAGTLTRAFAALAFLGVWALSSLFMNLGDRAEKLVYGRYNEAVIVPLLIVALVEILDPGRHRRTTTRRRAVHAWMFVGGLSVLLTGAALLIGRSTAQLHGAINPVNVLGIYPVIHRMGGTLHVLGLASIGLVLLVGLAAVAWRLPAVAAVALAGLFIFSAVDTQRTYFVPGTRARASQDVIATTLQLADKRFGLSGQCVGYDTTTSTPTTAATPGPFNYYAIRFLLLGDSFGRFDGTNSGARCGPLVISGDRAFVSRFPTARLVTFENDVEQWLWVLPGPLQERMLTAGWLLPDPTPGALPAAALHSSINAGVAQGSLTVLGTGRTIIIHVAATHDGAGSPWPALRGLKQPLDAVRLLARWYPAGGTGPPVASSTTELDRTILPGETARMAVALRATTTSGAPLPAGRYQVHLTLYQEHGSAFTDPGVMLEVAVR